MNKIQALYWPSLFLIFFQLNACSQQENNETKTEVNVPTYDVAIDPYYPPFEYRSDKGEFIGFDIELLDAIAEKENFKIHYSPRNILTIIDAVKDGKHDMGNSSIFILEDRKKIIDYSESYLILPLVFVGLDEPGNKIESMDDIKGKRISVQKDIIMEDMIDAYFAKDGMNEKIAEKTNFLALKNVLTGKADLVLDNIVSMRFFKATAEEAGKKLYSLRLPQRYFLRLGYVVRKGNTPLLQKLNRGIAAVKADGTYEKIYNKWFGENSQYPLDFDQLADSPEVPKIQAVK